MSVYWPMRGEPDLRPWMSRLDARGVRCALPVVVGREEPLVFRSWTRGCRLIGGVWKIPVPAEPTTVAPDVIIAPVVGFDAHGYRLGYGGGFFDRTLAVASKPVQVIGVAFEIARVPEIKPQSHDIPMDVVVTEAGIYRARLPTQLHRRD